MEEGISEQEYDYRPSLYLNPKVSDLSVVVDSEDEMWTFPAHKVILSVASEVFAKMLSTPLTEALSNKIVIRDASAHVVESLMSYVYKGRITFENWVEAFDVLKLAHKYQIPSLVKKCESFLTSALTLGNVCYILQAASLYSLEELYSKCLMLCGKGGFVVLKTKAFSLLQKEMVKSVVSLPYLNVENEMAIFKSLWHWAIIECCRKNIKPTEENTFIEFADFWNYVRFNHMNELERLALPKVVKESVECKKSKSLDKLRVSPYFRDRILSKKRKVTFYKDLASHYSALELKYRNPVIQGASQDRSISCIRFSLGSNAFLVEFALIAIFRDVPDYITVACQPSQEGNRKCFYLRRENFTWKHIVTLCDYMTLREGTVIVTNPFKIEAGVQYTLEAKYSSGKDPVKWPKSNDTKYIHKDNIHLIVHSTACYGIRRLCFIGLPLF